jgi:hypothetical protein
VPEGGRLRRLDDRPGCACRPIGDDVAATDVPALLADLQLGAFASWERVNGDGHRRPSVPRGSAPAGDTSGWHNTKHDLTVTTHRVIRKSMELLMGWAGSKGE